jgi:hypothetical protein
MSILFVMDWFGFTFGCGLSICVVFSFGLKFNIFVFSLGLATFGLALNLVGCLKVFF